MPALLTHQYFATLMIPQFFDLFPYLDQQKKAVWLGSQGPDPFFFYGHAIFKSRQHTKAINAFGNKLHSDNPLVRLPPLLQRLPMENNPTLLAYIFGALTHYVLDRTFHPYVYYHTGFDQQGELTPPYSYAHARFEVSIDIAFIQALKLDVQEYHPKHTLSLDKPSRIAIGHLYHQVYPLEVQSHHFFDATEDMQAVMALLFQAPSFRKAWISLLAGKQSLPVSLMHPKKLTDSMIDALFNLKQLPWYHPVTNVKREDSLPMLMEQAQALLLQFKPVLQAILQGKKVDESQWQSLFSAIDYDGKPIGQTFKYFKSFY